MSDAPMHIDGIQRAWLARLDQDGPAAWLAQPEPDTAAGALVSALAARRLGLTDAMAAAITRATARDDGASCRATASRLVRTGTLWGAPGTPRPALAWFDLPLAARLAEEAIVRSPQRAAAHLALAEALQELGQSHAARRHLEEAARLDPALAPRLATQRLGAGDPQGALSLLVGVNAADEPARGEVNRLRAQAAVAVARQGGAAARGVAVDALVASGLPTRARAEALFAVGALAEAEAEDAVGAAAVALAAGDDARADARLEGVPTADAWASRLRVALAVRADAPDARARLDALVDHSTEAALAEMLAWRAAWRLDHDDADGAITDARRARSVARGPHPAAATLQVLAVLARSGDRPDVHAKVWAELAAVMPDDLPHPARVDSVADVRSAATALRALLGGNLAPSATRLRDGRVEPLELREDPRDAASAALGRLPTMEPDAVLAALTALAARHPASPLPWTHLGELFLWLGRTDDAADALDRALALRGDTVWAWIGRGAADLLRADPAGALTIWETGTRACRGFEGPTLPAYRGEARWLLGDLAGARAELAVAVARHPTRLGAHVAAALVDAESGESGHAERLAAAVRVRLPGLAVDADAIAPHTDAVAWLRAVRRLLRGNRSSSVTTWVTDAGALRVRRAPTGLVDR